MFEVVDQDSLIDKDRPQEDLAEEGEESGIEKDFESEFVTNEPFDPQQISINSKVIALDTVLRRLKNGSINLTPDFQRKFVWDDTRKSLLIESLMLRIPLPMFYVSEDVDGNWEVVDGLQRLTTIKDFILGDKNNGKGDALRNLEFWGQDFNKKTFFEIENDPKANRVVNNIMESELSFTVIKPDTPELVKRNIFKRINTGGIRLSPQEIRNALYQGKSTELLINLSTSQAYIDVLNGTVKDGRMGGRELILRFIAFNIFFREEYKGDMDDFLSETMVAINTGSSGRYNLRFTPSYESLALKFKVALYRNNEVFGEHAFRKSLPGERKSPINKSLFELWNNVFSSINENTFKLIIKYKESFLQLYRNLLFNDDFKNDISRHGSSTSGVNSRFKKLVNMIDSFEREYSND
jgi:hypothetical protein